jgi:hypothetical protein
VWHVDELLEPAPPVDELRGVQGDLLVHKGVEDVYAGLFFRGGRGERKKERRRRRRRKKKRKKIRRKKNNGSVSRYGGGGR